jgi:hypothetical protein
MSGRLQQLLTQIGILGSRGRCRIFISYRRRGAGAGYAGRLADRLVQEFGAEQCFRDIDDIESGTDFVEAISKAVGSCQVLVVVVAPDWLEATDANGRRRLENPQDFVRIEIAAALARNTRVVPVLVGGAVMPTPEELPVAIEGFSRRQAHELSDIRWDYDVGQLAVMIEGLGVRRIPRPGQSRVRRRAKLVAAVAGGAIVVAGATASVIESLRAEPPDFTDTIAASNAAKQSVTLPGPVASSPPVQMPASPSASEVRYVPDPESAPSYDPVEAEGPAILAAMQRANEAEIEALHHLDPSGLEFAFGGDALQNELQAVQQLDAAGVHAVNTLHGQRIHSISLSSDGSTARVEATETWSGEYHRNDDDQCAARQPAHEAPQTVTLVRGPGGWIVVDIQHTGSTPETEPCY